MWRPFTVCSLIALALLAPRVFAADNACLGSGVITGAAEFAAYKRRCAECGGTWTHGTHPETGRTTEYCKLPDTGGTAAQSTAPTDPVEALLRAATAGSNRDAAKVLSQYNAQMAADAMRTLIQGDPQAEARRREAAARAAQARAVQEARDSERAAGLLDEMLGLDGDAPTAVTDDGGLELMDSDGEVARAPVGAAAMTTPTPRAGPAPAISAPSIAFTRGFEHGAGCFSASAGATCSGAAPDQVAACLDDYGRGYGKGAKQKDQRLADAYRRGAEDRAAGRRAAGTAVPDASGTCRIEVIQSYQRGFFGGPR